MCTVSWLFSPDGFDLLSNRDESHQRSPALPPRRWERAGVAFLAPVDGDAGGSWVTVNEHGLALCLLNLYGIEPPPRPAGSAVASRGELVVGLAVEPAVEAVAARLEGQELGRFRPFTLLALAPPAAALAWRWDGRRLVRLTAGSGLEMPLVSSGYDVAAARRARQALLAEMEAESGGLSGELLYEFHRSHRPERGPASPCMHRHDAETVSLSWVRVRRDEVSLAYAAGSPCVTPLGPALRLARTGVAPALCC